MRIEAKLKSTDSKACARQIVEAVPEIMRLIRSSVRKKGVISVPQVRVLSHLRRHPGASVSDVAYFLDVTIPSASAIVERLVRKNLVRRQDDPNERRRVLLNLTSEGERVFDDTKAVAQETIETLLECQSPERLAAICEGLSHLADAARALQTHRK